MTAVDLGLVAPPLIVTVPTRRAPSRAVEWIRRAGAHGAWIAVWSVLSWVGTASAPALLDKPFLLMLLAPRAAFIVLAAPHIGLVLFVLAGTFRLAVTDASWFIVGRRFPPRSTDKPRRWSMPWAEWAMRTAGRLCANPFFASMVLFFRPNGKYLGVAGAKNVSPLLAGVASISGTVLYLIAMHEGAAILLG